MIFFPRRRGGWGGGTPRIHGDDWGLPRHSEKKGGTGGILAVYNRCNISRIHPCPFPPTIFSCSYQTILLPTMPSPPLKRSPAAPAAAAYPRTRTPMWTRKRDLLYLIFFLVHIPVILCIYPPFPIYPSLLSSPSPSPPPQPKTLTPPQH